MKNENPNLILTSSSVAYNSASGIVADNGGNFYICGSSGNSPIGRGYVEPNYNFLRKVNSLGSKVWEIKFSISDIKEEQSARMPKVAIDSFNNVYVTHVDGDSYCLKKYDKNANLLWGIQSSYNNFLAAVVDKNNDVYVHGWDAENSRDSIAKYTSSGQKLWEQLVGLEGDNPALIAVDSDLNVYVAGNAVAIINQQAVPVAFLSQYAQNGNQLMLNWNTQTEGNYIPQGLLAGVGNAIYTTGIHLDCYDDPENTNTCAYLFRYQPNGEVQWDRTLIGESKMAFSEAYDVATDSMGNIYITGWTDTALWKCTQSGSYDQFVAKYDAEGSLQWVDQYGSAGGTVKGNSLCVDRDGNVITVGNTDVAIGSNNPASSEDALIVKYAAGTWVELGGVVGANTIGYGLAIDNNSNIYIAGSTTGSLSGYPLHGQAAAFLSQYSSEGCMTWTKQLGAADRVASTIATAITADSNGNIYIAGCTSGVLDGQQQTGQQDAFCAQYNSMGDSNWIIQFGVAGQFSVNSGLVSDGKDVFVTGSTGTIGNIIDSWTAVAARYDASGDVQWINTAIGNADAVTKAFGICCNADALSIVGHTNGGFGAASSIVTQDGFYIEIDSTLGEPIRALQQLGASKSKSACVGVGANKNGDVYVGGYAVGGVGEQQPIGAINTFVAKYAVPYEQQWVK